MRSCGAGQPSEARQPKSASVVCERRGDSLVAAKIGGRYLMYWGEEFVNLATSDDLVNWSPVCDEKGELLRVIEPRKGKFDSALTECGPPAVLTQKGILLLYNGKNTAGTDGDARLCRVFKSITGLSPQAYLQKH